MISKKCIFRCIKNLVSLILFSPLCIFLINFSQAGDTPRIQIKDSYREEAKVCLICRDGLSDNETTITCECCKVAYHDDCTPKNCSTLGCQAPLKEAEKKDNAPSNLIYSGGSLEEFADRVASKIINGEVGVQSGSDARNTYSAGLNLSYLQEVETLKGQLKGKKWVQPILVMTTGIITTTIALGAQIHSEILLPIIAGITHISLSIAYDKYELRSNTKKQLKGLIEIENKFVSLVYNKLRAANYYSSNLPEKGGLFWISEVLRGGDAKKVAHFIENIAPNISEQDLPNPHAPFFPELWDRIDRYKIEEKLKISSAQEASFLRKLAIWFYKKEGCNAMLSFQNKNESKP